MTIRLCPENKGWSETITFRELDVEIKDQDGSSVFAQRNVEVPDTWSDLAARIVAHKYFYGKIGDPDREYSVRQVIDRIVRTIGRWGLEGRYFEDKEEALNFEHELGYILAHQYACFNSPVQFNVGTPNDPQCSACFIIGVEDHMSHILDNGKAEGILFKYGSGTGSNRSKLRSSYEHTAAGGFASGPVTFMAIYDEIANVVKSGGKTRRAAKMEILDIDHPDILEQKDGSPGFIRVKAFREEMARVLAENGFDPSIGGEVYGAIGFQNANHSVSIPNAFFELLLEKGNWHTRKVLPPKEPVHSYGCVYLLKEIAKAAHHCGDPGVQFIDHMNEWNTIPNFGRIRSTNPCGEFVHVDDSACNLASINLKKFKGEDIYSFDFDKFKHVVDIMILAQDILIDNSAYPTKAIEVNSKRLRPLGLGYTNLGALLMSWGIPYDSDQGRAWCGAITAIMTGRAYRQSALIAERLSSFKEYIDNKDAFLGIIEKHKQSLDHVDFSLVSTKASMHAFSCWTEARAYGNTYGFRNSQVTLLAPTGTISFMMDCETTGIEPAIALRVTKKLAGGGELELSPMESVEEALNVMELDETAFDLAMNEIQETGFIEKSIDPEWLNIFATALGSKNIISAEGHMKMMQAAQPFLSGSISKTINMPKSATVEDIEKCYMDAWKMGLKNISIYRDGCKQVQPLNVEQGISQDPDIVINPEEPKNLAVRRKLPDTRKSVTHKFEVNGHEGYLTIGFFEDKTIGEIFVKLSKEGSFLSGSLDAWATAVSLSLQYGCPISKIVEKFSHWRFEPHGPTSNKTIKIATSLVDYIVRYIHQEFVAVSSVWVTETETLPDGHLSLKQGYTTSIDTTTSGVQEVQTTIAKTSTASVDAPFCRVCGAQMSFSGSCYTCMNCGADSGCG